MRIKNMFDPLKKIGKKNYFFRNGEEELYFCNEYYQIGLLNINGSIDVVVYEKGEEKSNYLNTHLLTKDQKKRISTILTTKTSTLVKCYALTDVLLEAFCKKP